MSLKMLRWSQFWRGPWQQPREWRWLVAAVLLIGGGLIFARPLSWFWQPDPPVTEVIEDFYSGYLAFPASLERVEVFMAGPYGWYLAPGATGNLRYRVVLAEPATNWVRLYLGFRGAPPHQGSVSLSVDGEHFVSLVSNTTVNHINEWQEIGSLVAGRREFWLEVTATVPSGLSYAESDPGIQVFDKIMVRSFSYQPPSPPRPLVMASALLWFGGVVLLLRRDGWRWVPVVMIAAGGLAARWLFFAQMVYGRTDPDAGAYRNYIERLTLSLTGPTGFYSGSFMEREPLFLAISKLFFVIFGASDTHLRLVSLTFSVLAIFAFAWVVRCLTKNWVLTYGGAAVMAFNGPLIYESVRGLRLEVELVLLLMWLWVLFLWRTESRYKGLVMGVVGGLLPLLRFYYFVPTILLTWYSAWRVWRHIGWRAVIWRAGVATLLIVALVVPHKYGIYRVHGDVSWDTKFVTLWLVNNEFGGQPGFPSKASVGGNAYQGPMVSYGYYLFGMHDFDEVLKRIGRGYFKAWRNMDVTGNFAFIWQYPLLWLIDPLFTLLIVVAFGVIFWRRRDWIWIPLATGLVLATQMFPYAHGLLEKYRHIYQAFPLVALAVLGLLSDAWQRLRGTEITIRRAGREKLFRL